MPRLYLRPLHFIESPQLYDGQAERLAGTMLWFCSVEIIVKNSEGVTRELVAVSQFDAAAARLPEALQGRAKEIFANLASARVPLSIAERTIRLDQPQVMGILNVTPDSFSDGGQTVEADAAIAAAHAMSAAGAAIIDVGGESTRPGAPLVWEGDEIKRVEPVITQLANSGTAISIDTRKAAVMEAAHAAGAGMINDISALGYDDRAMEAARCAGVPVALMHAPSQSSDPHKNAVYDNVVTDVYDFLESRITAAVAAGIDRDRIVIDPGIGFGKSLADNIAIINNLAIYHGLGCPLLFGASRKRMIGALSNEAEADMRLGGSLLLAIKAAEQGAHILRVHDVPQTVQALHVWRGLRDGALTVPGV